MSNLSSDHSDYINLFWTKSVQLYYDRISAKIFRKILYVSEEIYDSEKSKIEEIKNLISVDQNISDISKLKNIIYKKTEDLSYSSIISLIRNKIGNIKNKKIIKFAQECLFQKYASIVIESYLHKVDLYSSYIDYDITNKYFVNEKVKYSDVSDVLFIIYICHVNSKIKNKFIFNNNSFFHYYYSREITKIKDIDFYNNISNKVKNELGSSIINLDTISSGNLADIEVRKNRLEKEIVTDYISENHNIKDREDYLKMISDNYAIIDFVYYFIKNDFRSLKYENLIYNFVKDSKKYKLFGPDTDVANIKSIMPLFAYSQEYMDHFNIKKYGDLIYFVILYRNFSNNNKVNTLWFF